MAIQIQDSGGGCGIRAGSELGKVMIPGQFLSKSAKFNLSCTTLGSKTFYILLFTVVLEH